MTSDPLDDLVRATAGALPFPAGLEGRVRRSVARRRLAVGAAAALLVAGGLALFRPRSIEPPIPGRVFSLRDPAPEPLDMNGVAFTVEVRTGGQGLAFRFVKGGSSDE